MAGQSLHDGMTIDMVLPEAPWGEPAGRGRPLDDAAVASLLAQARSCEPGPWLAGLLETLAAFPDAGSANAGADSPGGNALSRLDPVDLGVVVAAAERVVSWARGMQARAAGELVEAQGGVLGVDQASMIIKDRLKVTSREGGQVAVRGDRCARFPEVLAALTEGLIDGRKADTLLGSGAELTDDERAAAIEVLLPEAPHRTWRWLAEQLNALNVRLHGGDQELRQAAAGANVWLEAAEPGMALLTALLPVKDAARVFNAVQAGANQLVRQPGQARRRGECRAAALTSLVTGRMVPHTIDEDEGADRGVGPGAGSGPVRVPVVEAGVLIPPVRDTDLIPVPAEDDEVASTAPVEAGVVVRAVEVPATINVTVSAAALANPGDDTPGIMELLGPIPARIAREIAAEGVWHRLVTDPVTGILTDYSTTTYQPPPRLRAAVLARDRVCQVGGCDVPGTRCDLDHIEPFRTDRVPMPGEPGQTRAENLHTLCRKHHNLKTHAGWGVHRDPATGREIWTSPTGQSQIHRPDPIDPVARYATVNEIATPESWALGHREPTAGLTVARPPLPRGRIAGTNSVESIDEPPF